MSHCTFEKKYFNNIGDFPMSFEGTEEIMTFSWQEVVTQADEIMFFGHLFKGG